MHDGEYYESRGCDGGAVAGTRGGKGCGGERINVIYEYMGRSLVLRTILYLITLSLAWDCKIQNRHIFVQLGNSVLFSPEMPTMRGEARRSEISEARRSGSCLESEPPI